MRRPIILGGVMILVLALAACAPGAANNIPTNSPTNFPTISVPVTGDTPTAAVPATSVSTETTGTEAPTTGTDITGTATGEAGLATATSETSAGTGTTTDTNVRISTSTRTGVSEPFLVDQQGRSLYLFTTDSQNGGTSACTAECLSQWQPVIVTGTPQAGQGVNASLLGTIKRDDGTLQATYNGWPLYTYAGDTGPGTTSGQGVGSAWYLVSGTGNAIHQ
ncbi:MAG: hypothetical protein ACM3XO_11665 [Bacteroidota bacterium]